MTDPTPPDAIRSDFAADPDMRELVELFVSELPERVESIHAAWSENELETVRRVAHQLKGACGGYGFRVIGDAAARLEADLKQEEADLERTKDDLDDLIDLCNRAIV